MQYCVVGGLEKSAHGPVTSAASAPVMTQSTPGNASALDLSMRLMRAWAWGLRSTAAWAMLGSVTSSA